MDLSAWAALAAAAFVMGVIPGPGVASIVGFAFSSGRRVALASFAGMAAGNALAMSVSPVGAGAVLASSALAFTVLKWAGRRTSSRSGWSPSRGAEPARVRQERGSPSAPEPHPR